MCGSLKINVRSQPEQLKLKKSKIISHSQRCRPASIKLQEIFIFSTSHRIPPIAILCIFIGAIQQMRQLGRWVDKESNKKWNRKDQKSQKSQSKKWCPSHKFFFALFSVTQSLFLLGFSSSSDNIISHVYPIQDRGGGTKGPPYQFFLSNFYKRRSFPCNFYKRRN